MCCRIMSTSNFSHKVVYLSPFYMDCQDLKKEMNLIGIAIEYRAVIIKSMLYKSVSNDFQYM